VRRPLPLRPPPPPDTGALRSPATRPVDCCPAAQAPSSPGAPLAAAAPRAHGDQGLLPISGTAAPASRAHARCKIQLTAAPPGERLADPCGS
jgi:hypothetical protein